MISSKAVSNSIGVDYTNENKVTWSRWNSMEIFKIFIVKAEMELQLARFSNSEELKIYTTKDHGFELHIYNASAQLPNGVSQNSFLNSIKHIVEAGFKDKMTGLRTRDNKYVLERLLGKKEKDNLFKISSLRFESRTIQRVYRIYKYIILDPDTDIQTSSYYTWTDHVQGPHDSIYKRRLMLTPQTYFPSQESDTDTVFQNNEIHDLPAQFEAKLDRFHADSKKPGGIRDLLSEFSQTCFELKHKRLVNYSICLTIFQSYGLPRGKVPVHPPHPWVFSYIVEEMMVGTESILSWETVVITINIQEAVQVTKDTLDQFIPKERIQTVYNDSEQDKPIDFYSNAVLKMLKAMLKPIKRVTYSTNKNY